MILQRKRLIWFLAAVTVTASAQVNADAPPFTADEIAIYRDFLLHYPEQLSNLIGMQNTTEAWEAIARFYQKVPPNLKISPYSGRQLPPEVMALTDEQAVTARIAAAGKLLAPEKRDPDRGPDGYAKTHLVLSEIAFDSTKNQAAFIFSASCRCKGGQGGTAVYELRNGQWKLKSRLIDWVG
jgi:hypothetical protein